MAGLFSRKNKKDQDDASSTSSNSNARYQGRPSNSTNGLDNLRDNSSANNSVSYSASDYSNHSPYPQQNQYQHYNNNNNGPSVYSSKSSLQQTMQYQQFQGNTNSATSFSTHHSTFNTVGAWSSGLVMSTNPFPRFAHTASYASTGTDIYVFGGIVKGSPQKDMHVIDA
ncbi:hypothetical protein BGX26_005245, partial [Mortierella sp. AD094]